MKKKERIKQLEAERDRARAIACEYEQIIAWYRGVEHLRFSKRDALDTAVVGDMLERSRKRDVVDLGVVPSEGPDIDAFMRVANGILNEKR